MTFSFRHLALAGVAATALATTAPAKADIIQLGFILDQSGSITASEWNIIRNGLSNAINTLIPVTGPNQYEISVVKFSDTAQIVVNHVLVDSVAARTAVAGLVAGMTQTDGFTNYALGLTTMTNVLTSSSNYSAGGTSYVNFATDGEPNRPNGPGQTTPESAAAAARTAMINAGIDNISVEGIGVSGSAASYLQSSICYPNCDTTVPYNFPAQGFYIAVANATEYASAIQTKIQIVTQVPEPATLALLGAGLLGLGMARRRKAA